MIITRETSKRVIDNYIFSTGFMGLESDTYTINYLYLMILSNNFNTHKDSSSTCATMMGINNDIFNLINVPNVSKIEAREFGKNIDSYIKHIIELQDKNYVLKSIKQHLLSKYFD